MGANPTGIGDIVEVYCTRCRLNLDASVAALTEGKVVKVMCRTCGNEVPYRAPVDMAARRQKTLDRLIRKQEAKRAPRKSAAPSAPTSASGALRKLWDELTDAVDVRYARVYDPKRAYEKEDALLHKQYGMGIVHDIHGDGTLNVLFRDGFYELAPPEEDDDE